MSRMWVKELFIYPVKGLSAQKCVDADLQIEHGIPGDRSFALMYSDACKEAIHGVSWMKKQNFAMQNDWHGLAALDCSYEAETGIFRVKRKGVELLIADVDSEIGRDRISTFFTGYLAGIYPSQSARHPDRARLQFVGEFGKTRYPDRNSVDISLVSQATINHLSELTGQQVDVRRFRPNIVLDGLPAWGEFDLVGQEMQLGTARIAITARINRCLNIDVNSETGERDISLLSLLKKNFQHTQTGVLAKVIRNGKVAISH
jgi:uncharacterized protein